MGKIAKPKKREPTVHSRSFRRNATPPTEVAKPKSTANDETDHWMYNAKNAGVHKKSKSKKGTTRQQHVRHLKALEKADRNYAVLENKITKSKMRGKTIQERAKDWDELNEELVTKTNSKSKNVSTAAAGPVVMEGIEEEPATNALTEASPADDASQPVQIDAEPEAVLPVEAQKQAIDKADDLDTIT